ncbi:MAG TPA: hypothetical protein VFQ53_22900 [Kofleriaceae bacterium]|nr:hypothetical protein [Kofleriaceae bacterium]
MSVACGGKPPVPKRLVVESDVGSWKFRRFQGPLLDIEVWVDGNKGEAYSASYITASSEKTGHIEDKDLVNVTVTRYERPDGVLRETVKLVRRLAAEKGYQVNEKKIEGVRALAITGPSETWVMWPSGKYVVKVGGQGRDGVPDSVVESYGDRYPSQLPGGALEGPLPPGPDNVSPEQRKPDEKDSYDPKNPKPDIEKYDPDKVKLPDKKSADPDSDEPDKPDSDKPDKPDKKKSHKKAK